MQYPFFVTLGTKLGTIAISCRLPILSLVKKYSFDLFCGGQTIDEALIVSKELQKKKIYTCLNYAVETQEEKTQHLKTINEISTAMKKMSQISCNKDYSFIAIKLTGLMSSKLLKKLQEKQTLSKVEKEKYHFSLEQIKLLCEYSKKHSIKLMFDAEESWIQDTIDQLLYNLMKAYNKDKTIIYTTVQMYRKDRLDYLKLLHKKATINEFSIGIKLVRGAYVEKEKEFSTKHNKHNVVFETKRETDKSFDKAMTYCFKHLNTISLFAGSHNEKSMNLFSTLYNNLLDENKKKNVIASQLFGMSDHLTFNLAEKKIPVCKYIPYGPIDKVIPYLIRRAEENTSILSNSDHQITLIESELIRRKKQQDQR